METRRLLKVKGSHGLYQCSDSAIGKTWQEWLPLPAQPDLDPTTSLAIEQAQAAAPKPVSIGLHAKSAEQEARDRRREADKALKDAGLR